MATLYQKGTQRIEIIVRKEGSATPGANTKDAEDVSSGGVSTGGKQDGEHLSKAELRRQRIIKTNTTHILAVSKQVIDLGIEYYIGGLGYRHGDKTYQEQVQRQVEIIKDSTNIASSIGMGVLYGSWGGAPGAIIGGLLGAVSSTASLLSKYKNRGREYEQTMFKENNSIQYMRSRANINLTTGRLR